jgi:hypothetical protein
MMKKLADEVKLALLTAACILIIALITKLVLHVETNIIKSNGPVYLFILYIITRGQAQKSKCDKPLYWGLGIVLITVLTIILYAF